jgi:hypothetical protein
VTAKSLGLFLTAAAIGQASFDEVWIDMQTNEIKRMIGFTGQVKQ